DMQVIGEAYHLLRYGAGLSPKEISEVFREWNTGELESYLVEITAEVLAQVDAETGKPLVDIIVDAAGQKGTGRWTVKSACDLGIPVTGIGEAVFARALSSDGPARQAAQGKLASGELAAPVDAAQPAAFIEDVRRALYASKMVAYARASTRSSRVRKNTVGTSTPGTWPASGVVAASSAPVSSTASSMAMRLTRSCRPCCWMSTSWSRCLAWWTRGAASSGPRPPRGTRFRCLPPRSPTTTPCAPSACRPR